MKTKIMKAKISIAFLILLFLWPSPCTSEEAVITSESMEHDGRTSSYRAEGSVRVEWERSTIDANTLIFKEKTNSIAAYNGVSYDDPDVSIKAESAEFDLSAKSGALYNAGIFIKKDNFHIKGKEVKKLGEGQYSLEGASFTTCDAPLPAWCLGGNDVRIIIGDFISARNVTMRAKGLPVLYTPYISAPVLAGRKTGFLTPTLGYSDSKGLSVLQPFFIAVSENRDITLTADIYSKRGAGGSLEYRYIEQGGISGRLYGHFIDDIKEEKNFLKIRAIHEQKNAFMDINFVNRKEFSSLYEPYLEDRAQRFLESDAELRMYIDDTPLTGGGSKLFIAGRYLIDLKKEDTTGPPQKLPEAGLILYPERIGPFVFSLSAQAANFIADKSADGQRINISPRITHSFGGAFTVFQAIGAKKTFYFLNGMEDASTDALEYEVSGRTRLTKNYSSLRHIIEPSVSYKYRAVSGQQMEIPLFDSLELEKDASVLELSLINRFIDSAGEFATLRVAEGFDFKGKDLLKADIALSRPAGLRAGISYDSGEGKIKSLNSELRIPSGSGFLSLGQRYEGDEGINLYTIGFGYYPSKTLSIESGLWYDEKEGTVRDITTKIGYKGQCWGVSVSAVKKPDDFDIFITIDLLGLGNFGV
jgi:hypothetical protein